MSKKEYFFDPKIVEKIADGRISSVYLDLGDQKELHAKLRAQSVHNNELLMNVYKKAEEILSTSQYKVFIAVFKHGYKIPTLARIHDIKRSTYYTHYYRALSKLRNALIEGGDVKPKKTNSKRKKEINLRNWDPFEKGEIEK